MRIGLIGWYGHDNAGDDRILFCLRRFLDNHEILVTSGLRDAMARIEDLNRCDYVIFGGGGLILRGYGIYSKLIDQIRPRLACVGISIEAVARDNEQLIEALKDKSDFILVRDARSLRLLGNHPKAILGPDVTFLYPFEVTTPVEAQVCGVNLRPWQYWHWEHNGRLHRFMTRLNRRLSFLKAIYPFPKWRPERAMAILLSAFQYLVPVPLYTEACAAETDVHMLRRFFTQVSTKFSPEDLGRCRFLVGMRLHSLIFACQMGIPFLSLSYQPKCLEFCRSLGLEHLSVNIYDLSTMSLRLQSLKDEYSTLRDRLISETHTRRAVIHKILHEVLDVIVARHF